MLGKRILTGTHYSFLLLFVIIITSCNQKKIIATSDSDTNEKIEDLEPIADAETVKKEEPVNKIEGNTINASLNCSGNSSISLLQLAEKKYDTEDFKCNVTREKGIKIQFTSESKKMEIFFRISGIETSTIEKGVYACKSKNGAQYLDVSLNAKSLGQHNFGDTFVGTIEILDYGMSSDIICGKFSVIDRKGNKIEGSFNETLSTF